MFKYRWHIVISLTVALLAFFGVVLYSEYARCKPHPNGIARCVN